jgi:hypothetical protein
MCQRDRKDRWEGVEQKVINQSVILSREMKGEGVIRGGGRCKKAKMRGSEGIKDTLIKQIMIRTVELIRHRRDIHR